MTAGEEGTNQATVRPPDATCRCGALVPPLEAEVAGRMFYFRNALCQGCIQTDIAEREALEREAETSRREWALARNLERIPPIFRGAGLIPPVSTWVAGMLEGGGRNLLLSGPVGSYKSTQAWAAFQALAESRPSLRLEGFRTASFLRALRPESEEDREALVVRAQGADVLLLDDLGRHKDSEFSRDTLFEILDARYEWRRPVITTSNAKPGELQNVVGSAVARRLLESCTVVRMPSGEVVERG